MSTPSQGTAFSDGVRIGSYYNDQYNAGVHGLSISPRMLYAVQPSASSNLYNAGLVNGQLGLTLPTGASYVTYQGYPKVIKLDCYRCLYASVATTVNPTVITVSGWDCWGQKLVMAIAVSTNSNYYSIGKSFAYINSIYANGNTAHPVVIATDNRFGFPFYLSDPSFAFIQANTRPNYSVNYNGTPGNFWLERQTGFAPTVGSIFYPGDTTSPAAIGSNDVRGTYYIPSNITGGAWFTMNTYVPGYDPMSGTPLAPDISTSPTAVSVFGVPQFSTGWQ